ncbi:MAG: hypothetical protein M1269_12585 [Chloroflexi bacterium]|nr:hypothetical protein [Chloroflexota bacterium]
MYLDGVNALSQLGAYSTTQNTNLNQLLSSSTDSLLGSGSTVDPISFDGTNLSGGWSLNLPIYEYATNVAWDYQFTTELGQRQVVTRDPVIIDWDGNGEVSTKGKENASERITWDVNADGLMDRTEWVKGDALVVYDANGDGKINDGREIMNEVGIDGTQSKYASGWDKVRDLFDKDGDGTIKGDELKDVKIWVDANADGVTDDGELRTAEQANIFYIDTKGGYVMRRQEAGNLDFGSQEMIGTSDLESSGMVGTYGMSGFTMAATTMGFGQQATSIFDSNNWLTNLFGEDEEEASGTTETPETIE